MSELSDKDFKAAMIKKILQRTIMYIFETNEQNRKFQKGKHIKINKWKF